MADITINISLPVLIANQAFKVEYRVQGTTPWTLWGLETSNTFTVTGLSLDECYEFQITFLRSVSPLIECDPVIYTKCIPAETACPELEGAISVSAGIYSLVIGASLPSPYQEACGGWNVYYGPATSPQGALTQIHYTSLLGVFPITIPGISNGPYLVQLYSVDCDGNEHLCDEVTIDPYSTPCDHAIISSAEIVNLGGWKLKLTVVPSNPASITYYLTYHQANAVSSGVPDPGGNVTLTPTGSNPDVFYIPISPNFAVYAGVITYVGALVDACNYSSNFDVSKAT